jgi:hypothetical protein
VLDQDLRVITASRSFYRTFKVGPEDTEGRLLYERGDGHWDIPKLRLLLEKIVPENGVMEDYEVEYELSSCGWLQSTHPPRVTRPLTSPTCSSQDQVGNLLGMRHQREVTCIQLDRGRIHAFCQEAFKVGIDGLIELRYRIP